MADDATYTGGRGNSRGEKTDGTGYTAHVPGSGTGYSDRGNSITAGLSVFAKAGASVVYFNDKAGTQQVGASGGKGGQDNPPSRTESQFVGTTTGQASITHIQVSWINRWWQNGKISLVNPNAFFGEWKQENKTSWVARANVDIQTEYKTTDQKLADEAEKERLRLLKEMQENGGENNGLDTTTLGIAAIGAALLFNRKKKRK